MSTTEIDALIEELKNDPKANLSQTNQPKLHLNSENIETFVLEKASKIIKSGISSIEEIHDAIQSTINPEEISSYAELIKATTGAIEAVNRINIQNKKSKTQIKIKEMDIDMRKKLPVGGNTNILIATREEVFKHLTDAARKQIEDTIDVSIEKEEFDLSTNQQD